MGGRWLRNPDGPPRVARTPRHPDQPSVPLAWRAPASTVPGVRRAPPQPPLPSPASEVATPPAQGHAPPVSWAPLPRGLGARLKGGRGGARALAAACARPGGSAGPWPPVPWPGSPPPKPGARPLQLGAAGGGAGHGPAPGRVRRRRLEVTPPPLAARGWKPSSCGPGAPWRDRRPKLRDCSPVPHPIYLLLSSASVSPSAKWGQSCALPDKCV